MLTCGIYGSSVDSAMLEQLRPWVGGDGRCTLDARFRPNGALLLPSTSRLMNS